MLEWMLIRAFALLFPKGPVAVITMVTVLLQYVVRFARDLKSYKKMRGPEKMVYLKELTSQFAAEAFDDLKHWGDLPNDRQLVIIEGFAEAAHLIHSSIASGVKPKHIRKKARLAAKKLKVPDE